MGRRPRGDAADPISEDLILADSSAWIELLRGSGHPVHLALRRLLDRTELVAVTDPVVMEILAGLPEPAVPQTREMILSLPSLPVRGLTDFEQAAEIYQRCRGAGETVRQLMDCLIAAVAIREDVEVLHNDADFDVIARHTALRTVALQG